METQLPLFSLSKKTAATTVKKEIKTTKTISFFDKKTSNKNIISIYIDGAARGNPGPSGVGIHIFSADKDLIKKGFFIGIKTNNQAEYLALALALLLIKDFITKHSIDNAFFSFFSDSELLVKQMNNTYKIKNPVLKQLQTFISSLLREHNYSFTHVFREKNKIADKLANEGIDKQIFPSPTFRSLLSQHGLLI